MRFIDAWRPGLAATAARHANFSAVAALFSCAQPLGASLPAAFSALSRCTTGAPGHFQEALTARAGAFVLVNPAGSDKIVRPRLAAPLFSMHTFYQLRLQQQLSKPLLIYLVSCIDSFIVRDHAFALNLASPSAPRLLDTHTSLPPFPAPVLHKKLFPVRPSLGGLRDPSSTPVGSPVRRPLWSSVANLSASCARYRPKAPPSLVCLRRRRRARRASQELTKKQALTAKPGWG